MFVAQGILSLPIGNNYVKIGQTKYQYVNVGSYFILCDNLDYQWGGLPVNNGTSSSDPKAAYYAYGNAATYGLNGTYRAGLMYNWNAVNYLEQNKASLLPDGWRVPSINDINSIKATIQSDTTSIKATDGSIIDGTWPSGWHGTNTTGVSIYPSGTHNGDFWGLGIRIWLWAKDSASSSEAQAYSVHSGTTFEFGSGPKLFFNYLRLIKDV